MNEAEIEADIVRTLQSGPMFTGLFEGDGEQFAIERMVERGTVRKRYNLLGLSKIELP